MSNNESSQDSSGSDDDTYRELPFYNKSSSSFIPPTGRDVYLDFYITAITEDILQREKKRKFFSNISKSELSSLTKLSRDKSIIIKKADESNTIVIMNRDDYKTEVL